MRKRQSKRQKKIVRKAIWAGTTKLDWSVVRVHLPGLGPDRDPFVSIYNANYRNLYYVTMTTWFDSPETPVDVHIRVANEKGDPKVFTKTYASIEQGKKRCARFIRIHQPIRYVQLARELSYRKVTTQRMLSDVYRVRKLKRLKRYLERRRKGEQH